MKVTSAVATWLGVAVASTGCGGAQVGEPMEPMVTVAPDEFVLRDVRKDAAQYLSCQVPNIQVTVGPWAGSEGNVTAHGCGYRISYYLRCQTNHQCSLTVSE